METTAKRKANRELINTAFSKVDEKIPSLFNSEAGVYEQKPMPTKSIHKQVIVGNPPAKSNCYRIIILKNKDKTKQHASLAKTPELHAYEKSFWAQCSHYRNAHINVPFEIELDCFYKTKQSDLDNTLKVILDCLQSIDAIYNDNLCDRIVTNKNVDKENPRIEFTLRAKEPLKEWVSKMARRKIVPKEKVRRSPSGKTSDQPDRIIQTVKPLF